MITTRSTTNPRNPVVKEFTYKNAVGGMEYRNSSGDDYHSNASGSLFGPCGIMPWLAKNRGPYNECMKAQQDIQRKEAEAQAQVLDAINTPSSGMSTGAIIGIVAGVVVVTAVAIIIVKKMRKKQ